MILADAFAAAPTYANSGETGGRNGERSVFTDGARQVDPYADGARVRGREPYTDGARSKFDPYTDGSRVNKFDVFTDGALL